MYVHYLAQNQYFEDENVLRYLDYLEYWRRPENARYLVYPNCLHMLTLLKEPGFRQEITRVELARLIMDDYWKKWNDQEEPKPDQDQPEPEQAPESSVPPAQSS